MAFSQIIARLGVQLGLDTASFETGSRKAQREVTTLQGKMKLAGAAMAGALAGLGAGIVLGGLQSAITGAFELASSLSEAAARVGLTVEALQELRLAAQDSGVSNEQLETSMAKLNVQLGDLQAGGKTAVAAFDAIGLSAKDLKGLSPEKALGVIADKLIAIEDPTLFAAAAQNLLGKSYATLIPLIQGGSKALEENARRSREQGQISTEEAKKLDELADNWENLKTRVSIATAGILAGVVDYFDWADRVDTAWARATDNLARGAAALTIKVVRSVNDLVAGISNAIGSRLNAIWEGATAKVREVEATFAWLYDQVVGHSHIPDMVDGIAASMQQLDAAMVRPVQSAATKSEQAFREMAGNVQSLLDRLFPEIRRALDYRADLATIAGSGLSDDQQGEARRRAGFALAGVRVGAKTGPDFGDDGRLTDGMRDFGAAIERLTDKAKIGTVKIADSFKDMADKTLQSLSNLTSAVKGGGFLNILESVIGLSLQLGSMGLFGKTIAGRLNSVPGYAGGTTSAAAGLAMVGERGPELVRFRGGEHVYNNNDSRAMLGGGVMEIRPSPLFDVYIDGKLVQAAPSIARAGAVGAIAMSNYRGSRRVG